MKFYINNKELSEKVFWRTLESLVTPLQRVYILEGMKVRLQIIYVGWKLLNNYFFERMCFS